MKPRQQRHGFVHWTESGRVVNTSPSYTFTMPNEAPPQTDEMYRLARVV
jgi:hypothetical protein